MKVMGSALVVLGILALIYGGFIYDDNDTVIEMGSMEISATDNQGIPVPVILGGIVLLGGVGLLVYGKRGSRA